MGANDRPLPPDLAGSVIRLDLEAHLRRLDIENVALCNQIQRLTLEKQQLASLTMAIVLKYGDQERKLPISEDEVNAVPEGAELIWKGAKKREESFVVVEIPAKDKEG